MAGTSEPVGGACLVCRTRTTNRCAACATTRLNLFFCSRSCQKLVWTGHKIFCGKKAYPLAFPQLSPTEVEAALRDLHKPIIKVRAEDRAPTVAPEDMLRESFGISRPTIDRHIQNLAEGKPYPPPGLDADKAQYFLAVARLVTHGEIKTKSLRDDILGFCARKFSRLIAAGVMPTVVTAASRTEAALFHHFVVAATISRMAQEVPTEQVPFQQRAAYTCRERLQEYATKHFSAEAGRAVRACLVFAHETQGMR